MRSFFILKLSTGLVVNVMGVEGSYRYPETIVLEGIARLREFYKNWGCFQPHRSSASVRTSLNRWPQKVTGVAYGGSERPLGGFKKLYWQDVLEIYKMAK